MLSSLGLVFGTDLRCQCCGSLWQSNKHNCISLSPLSSEVCIPLQRHLSLPWLLMEGAKGNKLPSPDTSDMCEDGWVECRPKIFYIFTVVSQPWHYQMIFQSTWKQEEKNLRQILAFLCLCTCKLFLPTHLAGPVPVWRCTRKISARVDALSAPFPP